MKNIFIKNIKGLVQVGENLPNRIGGIDASKVPVIENAFLALEDGCKVVAYGSMEDWDGIDDWRNLEVVDAEGCYVLPAFCDAHTHTVFAKTREGEFVDRINGLSYEEIALKGGGILNSARALSALSEDELYERSYKRVEKIIESGTGALEIKSGYGLTLEAELKMLRVIKRIKAEAPIEIKATFWGLMHFQQPIKITMKATLKKLFPKCYPPLRKRVLRTILTFFAKETISL